MAILRTQTLSVTIPKRQMPSWLVRQSERGKERGSTADLKKMDVLYLFLAHFYSTHDLLFII